MAMKNSAINTVCNVVKVHWGYSAMASLLYILLKITLRASHILSVKHYNSSPGTNSGPGAFSVGFSFLIADTTPSFVCGGHGQGEVSSIVYIEYQHKYRPLTIVYHALGLSCVGCWNIDPYVLGILRVVY